MSEGKRLAEIAEVREKEDGGIVQVVEESVSIAQVDEIVGKEEKEDSSERQWEGSGV